MSPIGFDDFVLPLAIVCTCVVCAGIAGWLVLWKGHQRWSFSMEMEIDCVKKQGLDCVPLEEDSFPTFGFAACTVKISPSLWLFLY